MIKKTTSNLLVQLTIILTLLFGMVQQAQAQLVNPVTGKLGGNDGVTAKDAESGQVFVNYFLSIWNSTFTIGAVLVLLYFVWGAVEWITSAGDAGKLTASRNKMLHAFIGLLLLVSSYTIIGFISNLLFDTNFNILQPTFTRPL